MNTEAFRNFLNRNLNKKSTLYRYYQKSELQKFAEFFDRIEAHPLTPLQRRAVILNEKRNLVVAGAGTGKTSVIIAKAGYLVKSGKVKPEELLLLAFNDLAAKELEERCADKLGVNIKAKTFHSLGKEILDTAENRQSSVSKLATDEYAFSKFLTSFILELKDNPKLWRRFTAFTLGKLKPYKDEREFKTLREYKSYVKSVELRTLTGELVKSFAELDIANFLFIKGVKFEYERRYKVAGVQYKPDFYLTDYDIYLEHFGIDKKGNTAPFVKAKNYKEQMVWKRNLHKEKGTKLLETYSWQRFEGTLLTELNKMLQENGVRYNPLADDEVLDALIKKKYTRQLGNLLRIFLTHFKSNNLNLSVLKLKAYFLKDTSRAIKFLELFQLFYERYQKELKSREDEIDFNDMIAKATAYIKDGSFKPIWKYIIVDEFQDISVDRYKLINALLKTDNEMQLFAVGDDWQSINRFAGSDISIMSKFRKYFGKASIVNIDKTFRFNNKIAELSGRFIQQNPKQLKKELVTLTHEDNAQVYLHHQTSNELAELSLYKIIEGIAKNNLIKNESLLVLARYNHLIEDDRLIQVLRRAWPGKLLQPQSIHKSKGKEADYVVVLGLDSSHFGFPSLIVDDPLLSLVLAAPDRYPQAEERRLFYVAVTRAKKQVHLIYDEKNPSCFVTELIEDKYDVHYLKKEAGSVEECPECGSGLIVDNGGGFFACSNYPFCHYCAPTCSACETSHMSYKQAEEGRGFYQCVNSECKSTDSKCPRCGIGAIIKKKGKYGDFLACHIWPRCSYTANE